MTPSPCVQRSASLTVPTTFGVMPPMESNVPLRERDDCRKARATRRSLAQLNLLHFANDGFQATLHWLLPILALGGGISTARWGLMATCHLLLGVVLGIPAGMAAERWGSGRILVGAMALYGGACWILATGTTEAQLWLAMLVSGLGFGVFHPVGFACVSQLAGRGETTGRTRAAVLGRFAAIGDVGRVALCWLAAGLIAGIGIQAGFLVGGTLAAIAAIVLWPRLKGLSVPNPAGSRPNPLGNSIRSQGWKLLSQRKFRSATAVAACDALSTTGLILFAPILLAAKGYAGPTLGLLVAVLYGGSLFGKLAIGTLADRWGYVFSLVVCQVGLVGVTLGLVLNSNFGLDLILISGLGMLTKGCLPIALAMTAEALEDRDYAVGFGLNQTVSGLAAAISPALFGWIASGFGVFLTAWIFAMGSCLAISLILSAGRRG